MRHATALAIFAVWSGSELGATHGASLERALEATGAELPYGRNACDLRRVEVTGIALDEIGRAHPTCPHCAVLYDEAWTARELFGRSR